MSKPFITILTVNWNTADYIELMLYAFSRLTYHPYKVLICDNGSRSSDVLKLIETVKQYDNVDLVFRQQKQLGSIAHGEALDLLIDRVDSEYMVIMDSDCTFLLRNWDKVLLDRFSDEVKIIGTPRVFNFGKDSSCFPSVFAVMLETAAYKSMNISCKPEKDIASQDTGWQWQEAYLHNGYKAEVFEARNTRIFKYGPFADIICMEFYLNATDTLISCHFGRGSSGGLAKYLKSWYGKIPVIKKYIARFTGLREKKLWLATARNVIGGAGKP